MINIFNIFKKKTSFKFDVKKHLIDKYPNVIGPEIASIKMTVNRLIDLKLVKSEKDLNDSIVKIIDQTKAKFLDVQEFLKENKMPHFKSLPRDIKQKITDNTSFSEDIKDYIIKFLNNKPQKEHKEILITDDLEKKLLWREQTLNAIAKLNGGFLYCENPASEFHLRRIPLDIGGRSPVELQYNQKNNYLATMDHIYPRSKFPDKEFDQDNIQVLSRKENTKKGGSLVIDYRTLQINNFINSDNKDFVLENWPRVLNVINEMPNLVNINNKVKVFKFSISIENNQFVILGQTNKDLLETNQFDLKWDLMGKCLNHKSEYDLKIDETYLKKFITGQKINLVIKNLNNHA